jgi:xylulokinase
VNPTALAVDLGSTACKASVVGIDGSVLGSGLAMLPLLFTADGGVEQDAELVWTSTLDACRAAIAEAGAEAAAAVVAVCAATQWSSIVPVDAAGLPVSNLHMWMDERGAGLVEALIPDRGGEQAMRWAEIHGFTPGTSMSHLLWFHRNTALHARTRAYLEPMDYLGARLTGRIAATANSVMPMGLTDHSTLGATAWSDELIERAGIDRSRLPELTESMSVLAPVLPDVAQALGIPIGTPVVTGANDSIAAAFGAGAIEPGQAVIMMGTTGVLVVHHPRRHVDVERFIVTMPSALDDRYYVVAEGGIGAKLIELALIHAVGEGAVADGSAFQRLLDAAAASTAGAGGVMFLPWVLGAAAPALDRRHRGALLGVSLATGPADIARAMLEGISMQMRWLADEVEQAIDTPLSSIRYVGGGAQSDVWSQIMADVVGRPIDQVANPRHANARGAALMAFVATGHLALDQLAALVPITATFTPDPTAAALHSERLSIVRDLHGLLAEPVARLTRSTNRQETP